MKITAKVAYASQAVLLLALRPPSQRIQAKEIAESQQIPLKFLEQILIQLKNAGLVKSIRGASGGYLLGRPAEDISLRDVVEAVEGEVRMLDVDLNDATIERIWLDIEEDLVAQLESISIQNIVNRKLRDNQILSFDI